MVSTFGASRGWPPVALPPGARGGADHLSLAPNAVAEQKGWVAVVPRRVLMIDDHAMVREGTRLLVAQLGLGCELLEAGSFAEAKRMLGASSDIDWVFLDLGLPDIDGMQALRRLREEHPAVPLVVLSSSEDRTIVLECINRGAMGFIAKASSGAELAAALKLIFAGGVYLPPALLGRVAPAVDAASTIMAAKRDELARLGLTPRQIEVLELMVQGLSNKLIATRLSLSEATVKTHVAAGLRGLNVKNRTQAVFTLANWRPGLQLARGRP